MNRVVVTGVGCVSPLGHNASSSWEALTRGESGVGAITLFESTDLQVKAGGEIKNWTPKTYMNAKQSRRLDRFQQFARVAIDEAVTHSGLDTTKINPRRSSVVFGTAGAGGVRFESEAYVVAEAGPRRINPTSALAVIASTVGGYASVEYGFEGPSFVVTSACATGGDAIGNAFDRIRLGRSDVVITGASDSTFAKTIFAGFDRVGICSHQDHDLDSTVRPFDKTRSGTALAEGAGAMVLESLEMAEKRGAPILAEVVGYGTTSDAHNMTAPHPDARGIIHAMQDALADAGIDAGEVDYINAHGTGTLLNDQTETQGIKAVFREKAHTVPISSVKGATGHAMGASSAIEAVFCVKAIQDHVIPPTINYSVPDPKCDLDYTPNQARDMPVHTVMTTSLGFGGHNTCLVFRAY